MMLVLIFRFSIADFSRRNTFDVTISTNAISTCAMAFDCIRAASVDTYTVYFHYIIYSFLTRFDCNNNNNRGIKTKAGGSRTISAVCGFFSHVM